MSLSTNRPPAMIGEEKVFIKRIKHENATLLSHQCIIDQISLFGKLSAALKEVKDSLITLINFMRFRSALQHKQVKEILSGCDLVQSFSD